ncbi:MAG: AAA family ATPase [Pyrinomonadaceae bacterium]
MTHEDKALDHKDENDTQYDDLSEPERYDKAIGWEPEYPHQKLLDAYRKNNPETFSRDSMRTTKPARAWQRKCAANKPKQQLFGHLWRTGELAVLFGESGAGKSILAIQIAESIARGKRLEMGDTRQETASKNALVSRLRSPVSPALSVLLFDFQHTAEQFAEHYSCPSPIPGKLPVCYRFSPNLPARSSSV